MKCPSCGTTLTMTERQGVEIDYCPNCRGVWLDRGELDKILDRAQQYMPGQTPPLGAPRMEGSSEVGYTPQYSPNEQRERYGDQERYPRTERRDDDYDDYSRRPKRKREGFLSELFDFD